MSSAADAMSFSNLTFHVGLHKTGTTFLQEHVFPRLGGVENLVWRNLEYFLRLDHRKVYFVSCEGLSGSTFAGTTERIRAISLLGAMFPCSRIMITVRPHGEYLKSLYSQYLRYGGTEPFERFVLLPFDEFGGPGSPGGHLIRAADLSYRAIIEAAEKSFSVPPLVYTMADMFRGPASFVEQVCGYVHCTPGGAVDGFKQKSPSNVGIRKRQASLLRAMNRFFEPPLSLDGRNRPYATLAKFRLDPVAICFRWLRMMPSPDLVPEELITRLNGYHSEDWQFVEDYVKAKRWAEIPARSASYAPTHE
jgi:hypothetical protein